MAGRTKHLIDQLIALRARNNVGVSHFLRAHLLLKGIDPDAHDEHTPDDPEKIAVLERMIQDFTPRR
jgi:hypothetical protein